MPVSEMRDNDLARRYPNLPLEEQLIQGAIDVYEQKQWARGGWSMNGGEEVCILESINVARYGKGKSSDRGVPKAVLQRIHRAIWPERDTERYDKARLSSDIIRWNDTQDRTAPKKTVVSVLKKALALGREEKGAS